MATLWSSPQPCGRSCNERPRRLENQPQSEREQQRKGDAFGGQCEGRDPVAPCGTRESAVEMERQVAHLAEKTRVERVHGRLEMLYRGGDALNGETVGVENRIATGEVVLDEFVEIAAE